MFFSGVSPLEKVKIKKSCGILNLEKTENSLESVSSYPGKSFRDGPLFFWRGAWKILKKIACRA